MDFDQAIAALAVIPRRIDGAEIAQLESEHAKESLACRQYRFAMDHFLRNLADEIRGRADVSALEYNMIMSHARLEAVRILCQLQLSERDIV